MGKEKEMTAREYLDQIRVLDAQIQNLLQEVEDLRKGILPGGISYQEYVQSSPDPDPYGTWAGKVEDKETILNHEIDALVDLRIEVTQSINRMQDERHIRVLYLRYVKLMKFWDIAEDMGYAYKYIRNLHKQAFDEFEKQFNKNVAQCSTDL